MAAPNVPETKVAITGRAKALGDAIQEAPLSLLPEEVLEQVYLLAVEPLRARWGRHAPPSLVESERAAAPNPCEDCLLWGTCHSCGKSQDSGGVAAPVGYMVRQLVDGKRNEGWRTTFLDARHPEQVEEAEAYRRETGRVTYEVLALGALPRSPAAGSEIDDNDAADFAGPFAYIRAGEADCPECGWHVSACECAASGASAVDADVGDLFALAVDLSALPLPLFGLSSEHERKLHRLIERARDLTSPACTFCEEPLSSCGCDDE